MKLIVVEGDRLVGPAAQAVLARAGHRVAGLATTAAKAVRLASQCRPTLAVVNRRLGAADGMEAVARLKAECGVPSLVVTDVELDVEELQGLAVGVVRRPVAPDALVRAVDAAGDLLAGRASSGA